MLELSAASADVAKYVLLYAPIEIEPSSAISATSPCLANVAIKSFTVISAVIDSVLLEPLL